MDGKYSTQLPLHVFLDGPQRLLLKVDVGILPRRLELVDGTNGLALGSDCQHGGLALVSGFFTFKPVAKCVAFRMEASSAVFGPTADIMDPQWYPLRKMKDR